MRGDAPRISSSWPWRRGGLALLAALLLAGPLGALALAPLRAEDAPGRKGAAAAPRLPEEVAEAVIAAPKGKQAEVIESLAVRDEPDPWYVADALLGRGKRDLALRFAQARPRARTEGLEAWVRAFPTPDPDAGLRKALAAVGVAMARMDESGARKALPQVQARSEVVAVRLYDARVHSADDADGVRALAAQGPDLEAKVQAAGWPAGVARVRYLRARCQLLLRQTDGAALLESALEAWRKVGGTVGIVDCLTLQAQLRRRERDHAGRQALLKEAVRVATEARDDDALADAANELGNALAEQEAFSAAVEHFQAARAAAERNSDLLMQARALGNEGRALDMLGREREAIPLREREREIWREMGEALRANGATGDLGNLYYSLGDLERAKALMEEALATSRTLKDDVGRGRVIGNLALVYARLGDQETALQMHEESLRLRQEAKDTLGVARAAANIGQTRLALGDYAGAALALEQARAAFEAEGARGQLAMVLLEIAHLAAESGDPEAAQTALERARQLAETSDLGEARAQVAHARGTSLGTLGRPAEALEALEDALRRWEALGHVAGQSRTLLNLGSIYYQMGDYVRAKALQERALGLAEQARDAAGLRLLLGNLANTYLRLGEVDEAIRRLEEVRRLSEATKSRADLARAIGNLAVAVGEKGDGERALALHKESIEHFQAAHMDADVALAQVSVARWMRRKGEQAEAERLLRVALASAEDLRERKLEVDARTHLAFTLAERGDTAGAMAEARKAIQAEQLLWRGLADDEGALARGRTTLAYEVGATAALARGDVAELTWFLESGRAGTLRQDLSLRGRDVADLVPAELLAAEREAREAESKAVGEFRRARARRDTKALPALRSAMDEASGRVAAAVTAIRRSSALRSSPAYAQADDLASLKKHLKPGQVLVLYALLGPRALAVVVEAKAARHVDLGPAEPLLAAVGRALAPKSERDSVPVLEPAAVAELEKRLVAPLALPKDSNLVLISPEGPLTFVPFALLFPDRDLALLPSGSALGMLLPDEALRGADVLALGDPDYRGPGRGGTRGEGIVGRTPRLRPLPATRAEAQGVGTVTLLGPDANEEKLVEALGKRPRWGAIHFACHGLIDSQRPLLSALALTPTEATDGFLTALEILRLRFEADLVALSACETGRGTERAGEGLVGMVRAFLCTGSSRVLATLWPVDDESAAALVREFYAAWRPRDGGPGLAPAAALRQAQERIAKDPRWSSPEHWAGWVLWGLPR